tara:strand:- start:895 stop:1950 length:1056 start_codon:yes stop_codon:yes gene_type:complete
MSNDILNPQLRQRGRAEVNFMVNMFKGSTAVRQKADSDIQAAVSNVDTLPDDMDARSDIIKPCISDSRSQRVSSLVGEWHARNHGNVCERAFEDIFPTIKDGLKSLENGPAELYLDPDFKAPAYWNGVEFHRTEGGWDGHPFAGYIHAEIIHRRIVNLSFPGGIFLPRKKIAARAPKESYDTILDMGCSTAHFTQALQETYPDAKITGVDLSARTLEHARRVANANGWDWQLYQRAAENTGFDDESFDLVASYILLHEVPASAIEDIIAESFRLLKPGGDMIMSDVTRFSDVDKLTAWKMDQGAKYGGEPHWRESASADLGAIAKKVGFINVNAAGDKPRNYPYVVQGRKP